MVKLFLATYSSLNILLKQVSSLVGESHKKSQPIDLIIDLPLYNHQIFQIQISRYKKCNDPLRDVIVMFYVHSFLSHES